MARIVFDVDNVLADTTNCWCIKASKYLGKPVLKTQIKHDKIIGSVDIPAIEIYRLQDAVWEEWQVLPTTEEGIPNLISKLRESNHITIATCRPIRSANLVLKWLKKNEIPFDYYQCLGPYRSKSELECDVLIDDAPNQITRMINKGKRGFLYLQPWNISSNIDKVVKIRHLKELLDYF